MSFEIFHLVPRTLELVFCSKGFSLSWISSSSERVHSLIEKPPFFSTVSISSVNLTADADVVMLSMMSST